MRSLTRGAAARPCSTPSWGGVLHVDPSYPSYQTPFSNTQECTWTDISPLLQLGQVDKYGECPHLGCLVFWAWLFLCHDDEDDDNDDDDDDDDMHGLSQQNIMLSPTVGIGLSDNYCANMKGSQFLKLYFLVLMSSLIFGQFVAKLENKIWSVGRWPRVNMAGHQISFIHSFKEVADQIDTCPPV